jgi:cell division protein FtsQ
MQALAGLARRLLRWLLALGLLSMLGAAARLVVVWEPHRLPVRVVTVDGEVEHLRPEQLQATVMEHLDGGILTQNLAQLKAAVEAMPWVRSASLHRHWPDRLELAVVEEVPLARWGKDALVSADGVVFRPPAQDFPQGLPALSGRDEESQRVVEHFQSWATKLASLDLHIEELSCDARGAWTLHLKRGLTLALGKAHVEERISRFLRIYPQLIRVGLPSLIDMRYSNGLAIRWADPERDGHGATVGDVARSAQLNSRPSGPSRS